MEDALALVTMAMHLVLLSQVLILVIMEDALAPLRRSWVTLRNVWVLILVVMEDALAQEDCSV